MKQRSVKIAFYACKINIKLGFMEACYNIKDQYSCKNSHTFTVRSPYSLFKHGLLFVVLVFVYYHCFAFTLVAFVVVVMGQLCWGIL